LVASVVFMLVFILSAVDPRMTIHHSGGPRRQGGSSTFLKEVSMAADPEPSDLAVPPVSANV
jgi:hypothetical protein